MEVLQIPTLLLTYNQVLKVEYQHRAFHDKHDYLRRLSRSSASLVSNHTSSRSLSLATPEGNRLGCLSGLARVLLPPAQAVPKVWTSCLCSQSRPLLSNNQQDPTPLKQRLRTTDTGRNLHHSFRQEEVCVAVVRWHAVSRMQELKVDRLAAQVAIHHPDAGPSWERGRKVSHRRR